jgi:hypothetical protein
MADVTERHRDPDIFRTGGLVRCSRCGASFFLTMERGRPLPQSPFCFTCWHDDPEHDEDCDGDPDA